MVERSRTPAIPDDDRTFLLMEAAYGYDGITVLGWADNMVVWAAEQRDGRVTFDVLPAPRRTHEDEVLVIAIRVPHPDEKSLAEIILGCPCCNLDGTHRHDENCMHPCCPDEDDDA